MCCYVKSYFSFWNWSVLFFFIIISLRSLCYYTYTYIFHVQNIAIFLAVFFLLRVIFFYFYFLFCPGKQLLMVFNYDFFAFPEKWACLVRIISFYLSVFIPLLYIQNISTYAGCFLCLAIHYYIFVIASRAFNRPVNEWYICQFCCYILF